MIVDSPDLQPSIETGLLSRVGDTNRFEDLGKVVRDDS